MLKEVTSLFDYFRKAEADPEYQYVAIFTYALDGCNKLPFTYEMAKLWIDKWVKENIGSGYERTCDAFVYYMNSSIRRLNTNSLDTKRKRKNIESRMAEWKSSQASQSRYLSIMAEKIDELRNIAKATNQPVFTAQQQPAPTELMGNAITTYHDIFATPIVELAPIPQQAAPTRPYLPGDVCEYGWYDQEIEDGIARLLRDNPNTDRAEAVVRYFNDNAITVPIQQEADDWYEDNNDDIEWPTEPDDDPMEER